MAPRARRVTTDARISNPQKVLYPAAKFSKADALSEKIDALTKKLLGLLREGQCSSERYTKV